MLPDIADAHNEEHEGCRVGEQDHGAGDHATALKGDGGDDADQRGAGAKDEKVRSREHFRSGACSGRQPDGKRRTEQ